MSSGFITVVTGTGGTPAQSLATTRELGSMFTKTLRDIQTVNGADSRYLYTAIQASVPDRATEKISSRLRTVIIVAVAGVILIFGAVSLGSALSARSRRRKEASQEAAERELDDDDVDDDHVDNEDTADEDSVDEDFVDEHSAEHGPERHQVSHKTKSRKSR